MASEKTITVNRRARHEFHRVTANHVAMLKPPFVRQITGPLSEAIADGRGQEFR